MTHTPAEGLALARKRWQAANLAMDNAFYRHDESAYNIARKGGVLAINELLATLPSVSPTDEEKEGCPMWSQEHGCAIALDQRNEAVTYWTSGGESTDASNRLATPQPTTASADVAIVRASIACSVDCDQCLAGVKGSRDKQCVDYANAALDRILEGKVTQ